MSMDSHEERFLNGHEDNKTRLLYYLLTLRYNLRNKIDSVIKNL